MDRMGKGKPKLKQLVEILQEHFAKAARDGVTNSRAMIFTTMRDGVADICATLNALPEDLIKTRYVAMKFFF